ncbi:Na+/H+ antiporter subunit E [Myxococcaceae bacterium GXIMD 01537]
MHPRTHQQSGPGLRWGTAKSALLRVLFLCAAWWALCDGDLSSLRFGIPVLVVGAAVSFFLSPPREAGWTLLGLVRFAAFFLAGSVHGGFDVARRALQPSLPISPVFVRYSLRIPPGPPQTLYRITLSLMPGTVNADILGNELVVHALVDRGEGIRAELTVLEQRIAQLFGLTLPPEESAHA